MKDSLDLVPLRESDSLCGAGTERFMFVRLNGAGIDKGLGFVKQIRYYDIGTWEINKLAPNTRELDTR